MENKKTPHKKIGEILIEEGFLDPSHLDQALEIQKKEGRLLGEILIQEGWLQEEELVAALSKQLNLPFIRLENYSLNPRALHLVSREFALQKLLMPFEVNEDRCSIVMGNPLDELAREEFSKIFSSKVQIFLAEPSEIRKSIEQHYPR
jgi:type IV pilus assembly protein PilB